MKKRMFAALLLIMLFISGAAHAQTLPSNAVFSPGLVRLAALEGAGRTQMIALDKTGTVTEGQPRVTDVIPIGMDKNGLLSLAAWLEKNSEHPLAKAVTAKAEVSLLPCKVIDVSFTIENDILSGVLKVPFMGKIKITDGRKVA